MDKITAASPKERDELFRKVSEAGKSVLLPGIIEKDFWVCRILYGLFHEMTLRYPLVFKGGTSLSKAFRIIDRFSEDVDLTIELPDNSSFLSPAENGIGRNESERRIAAMASAGEAFIRDEFIGMLRTWAGEKHGMKGWTIAGDESDSMTVLFTYPEGVKNSVSAYVKPAVKLEFGVRGESWPSGNRSVSPIIAGHFPQVCGEYASFSVRTLDAERTFWEKATLLHAEYHRPGSELVRERLARHYYDLFMLSKHTAGESALARMNLLEQVVNHKCVFFRSGWAQYKSAKPGSFHLLPDSSRIKALQQDYLLMWPMFSLDPPSWEEVLEGLNRLEVRINAAG